MSMPTTDGSKTPPADAGYPNGFKTNVACRYLCDMGRSQKSYAIRHRVDPYRIRPLSK